MNAALPDDPDTLAPLAARIEEAATNAWPALQQQRYHGWTLRFSRGFTRRANSVATDLAAQTLPDNHSLQERIRYCENRYAAADLATVFRLTSLGTDGELDAVLADRGYRRGGETLVLARELNGVTATGVGATDSVRQLAALQDWLDGYSVLAELPPAGAALHRAILRAIPFELGLWVAAGAPAAAPRACGLGVLEAELLGLFDIITDARHRQQGYGRALVQALLSWGADQGARYAYLQVAADNTPALALYERFEFSPLYRYWYRQSN
ncbi:MAG: GNAT family N-acetyltransferase [Pseudomonadota bacterium]